MDLSSQECKPRSSVGYKCLWNLVFACQRPLSLTCVFFTLNLSIAFCFFRIDIKNDPYFMKMKYQKEYPGLASVGNGPTTDSYFGQGNLNCNYLESILSLHHSWLTHRNVTYSPTKVFEKITFAIEFEIKWLQTYISTQKRYTGTCYFPFNSPYYKLREICWYILCSLLRLSNRRIWYISFTWW